MSTRRRDPTRGSARVPRQRKRPCHARANPRRENDAQSGLERRQGTCGRKGDHQHPDRGSDHQGGAGPVHEDARKIGPAQPRGVDRRRQQGRPPAVRRSPERSRKPSASTPPGQASTRRSSPPGDGYPAARGNAAVGVGRRLSETRARAGHDEASDGSLSEHDGDRAGRGSPARTEGQRVPLLQGERGARGPRPDSHPGREAATAARGDHA